MKVRGSRRRARELIKACGRPWTLADMAAAGVAVWPGLLLAAMAEAIDLGWTVGEAFCIAYAIQGNPGAAIYVQVADGAPIGLGAQPAAGTEPVATVYASERAFLAMLAGVEPPAGEQVLLTGEAEPVRLLHGWFAAAQGLQEAP